MWHPFVGIQLWDADILKHIISLFDKFVQVCLSFHNQRSYHEGKRTNISDKIHTQKFGMLFGVKQSRCCAKPTQPCCWKIGSRDEKSN